MLGALLAPCGAGAAANVRQSKWAAQQPAQNLDGARRPELSVARRRDLGRAPHGFVRQCTKPVSLQKTLLRISLHEL